jgi:hypothetical protein
MRNDGEPTEAVREFRLEGTTLVVAVAFLLVALFGAFYVGRRVERSLAPAPAGEARAASDALAEEAKSAPPADVDRSSGYFDKVEGERKQPEPERETWAQAAAPAPATSPVTSAPEGTATARLCRLGRTPGRGSWSTSPAEGYPVRLFNNRGGRPSQGPGGRL